MSTQAVSQKHLRMEELERALVTADVRWSYRCTLDAARDTAVVLTRRRVGRTVRSPAGGGGPVVRSSEISPPGDRFERGRHVAHPAVDGLPRARARSMSEG